MSEALISLLAALAVLLALDFAAARWGIDSRRERDPRQAWVEPTWPIR